MILLSDYILVWKKRNARTFKGSELSVVELRTFKGSELSVVELKLQLYRSLMDWMSAIGLVRFSNMLEFIDYCSF